MRSRRSFLVAVAFISSSFAALASGSPTALWELVWVLDSEAKTLVCIGLPHGKRLAELPLDGAPEFLLQSPDGSRLVVLDRGPGEDKGERGYKAKGKSVATIVDPASRAIVARVEVGWGIDAGSYYFNADGRRLTLLCPGYEHKNAEKALARELVNIDLVTGVETGRVTLEHGTVPIGTDGRTLTLMRGLPRGSDPPFEKGRLSIVDLTGPAITAAVATGSWFRLASDGAYAYLLHQGYPHRNPRINRNGSALVYSTEGLETTLDVGREPRALYRDARGGQFFILSDAPFDAHHEAAGRLHVIRGPMLAATLEVAANPRLVERKGQTVFVVGEAAVNSIDPVALQVIATIPLRNSQGDLVDDDDVPTELRLTGDGKRAFILYGLHNKVAVLDLEAKVAVGATKTGPPLEGLLKEGLLKGLVSGFFSGGLLPGALEGGLGTAGGTLGRWFFDLYGKRRTSSMLAVHPNGRVAYAANSHAEDPSVSVIDASTARRLEQFDVRGHDLRLLLGGDVLAVLTRSEIHLFDTATNSKIDELDVSELRAFQTTADGAYVVALGKREVLCISGTTGKVLTRLTDFANPVALVVDGGGK